MTSLPSKTIVSALISLMLSACDPGSISTTGINPVPGNQIVTCELQLDYSSQNATFENEIDEVLGNARSVIADSGGHHLYILDDATRLIYKVNIETGEHELIYADADQSALNLILDETNNRLYCCLLYTSPSPRDATLSRMPSSA